jgi:hypothetical protein
MTRPKRLTTSADIDAEIRRLESEKARAVAAEDQRRGALIREYLAGANGGALRAALAGVVSSRDAFLFGIDRTVADGESPSGESPPIAAAGTADGPSRGSPRSRRVVSSAGNGSSEVGTVTT